MTKYPLRAIRLRNFHPQESSMKNHTLAEALAALPEQCVLAGIRDHIMREGLAGNLEAAATLFRQVWQCAGCEGTRAELAAFLVARYAYGGRLETARELYALFASLGDRAEVLQPRATALHILVSMLMEVKSDEAFKLWQEYIRLPIAASFKALSAQTGLALLRLAHKNSNSRLALVVYSALRTLAQETGEAEIAANALAIVEKWQGR